jgi:hypothetical protein
LASRTSVGFDSAGLMQQAFGRRGQDRHPRPRYPPEDRRLACLIEAIAPLPRSGIVPFGTL